MWFIYALLGAFGKSYSGFFRKKMIGDISAVTYIWFSYTVVLIVLAPIAFTNAKSAIDLFTKLPFVVLGAALFQVIPTQLNFAALKREDLSYTAPLNAFVPVFTLLFASIFLNEKVPSVGIIAVFFVFIGAYIISIQPGKIYWYAPLVRLVASTGAQLSICVAFGYAINTILLKIMTNNDYNSFVVMYVTTLVGWLLLIYVPVKNFDELRSALRSNKVVLFGGALSSFAGSFFHILAVASTYASYAVSVRRADSIISIFLGWRYLKETNIRYKLIGSIVMTVGAIIMSLSA
jgi:drug/metabolite transporter (DMT)-like permease